MEIARRVFAELSGHEVRLAVETPAGTVGGDRLEHSGKQLLQRQQPALDVQFPQQPLPGAARLRMHLQMPVRRGDSLQIVPGGGHKFAMRRDQQSPVPFSAPEPALPGQHRQTRRPVALRIVLHRRTRHGIRLLLRRHQPPGLPVAVAQSPLPHVHEVEPVPPPAPARQREQPEDGVAPGAEKGAAVRSVELGLLAPGTEAAALLIDAIVQFPGFISGGGVQKEPELRKRSGTEFPDQLVALVRLKRLVDPGEALPGVEGDPGPAPAAVGQSGQKLRRHPQRSALQQLQRTFHHRREGVEVTAAEPAAAMAERQHRPRRFPRSSEFAPTAARQFERQQAVVQRDGRRLFAHRHRGDAGRELRLGGICQFQLQLCSGLQPHAEKAALRGGGGTLERKPRSGVSIQPARIVGAARRRGEGHLQNLKFPLQSALFADLQHFPVGRPGQHNRYSPVVKNFEAVAAAAVPPDVRRRVPGRFPATGPDNRRSAFPGPAPGR